MIEDKEQTPDEPRVTSVKAWKEFRDHPCFKDILDDLKEREAGYVRDFKEGNVGRETSAAKTFDDLRVRIDELGYMIAWVDDLVSVLESAEKNSKPISEDKENSDVRSESNT